MAGARDLLIRFLGDSGGLKKATDDADASTSKLGGNLKNLAGTVAAAYVTTQIVAFGKASVEAALADEAAQKTLATTLKNVTGATDAQIAAAEDYILKLALQTGVADDELRPALDRLVRATGDVEAAQGLLSLAMDISAGTGKELSVVTEALGKAQDGNTGALKRLGVATTDANGNALTFEQTVASLADTFKGQAAAAADTNAGKLAKMKVAYGELQESIGTALLPILGELVGIASKLIGWFSSLDEGTQEWIARIVILGGGLLVAMKAVTGITTAFGGFKAALTGADGSTSKFVTGIGKALPALAAAGVLIKGLTDRSSDLAAIQAWRTDQIQAYADAVKAGGDQVQALVDRLTAVGTVDITFDEFKGDLTGAMQEAGVSVDAFATAVIGGEEGLTRLRDAMEEAGVAGYQQELIMMGATQQQGLYNKGVDAADRFNEVYEASLDAAAGAALGLAAGTQTLTQSTADGTAATNTAKAATEQLTNRIYEGVAIAEAAAAATGKMIAAELAAEAATRAWDQAWLALTGNLDAEQAMINLAQQIDDVKVAGDAAWLAQQEATAAFAAGAADAGVKAQAAEDAQRSYQSALIGTKQSVIDIGKEIGLLPNQVQTLIDLQDNGEIEAMENRLNIMSRNRTMALSITAKGGSGVFTVSGIGAEGGIVTQPTRSIIGDNGPEMVIPLDRMPGASSLPSNLGGGGGFTFINHAPIMAKQDVARELYDLIVDGQRRGELVGSLA